MPIRSLVPSFSPALWAVIGFLLLMASLSTDSIDMDEAQTWDYARLGTFPEFCHELNIDSNSEAQMPLGMFSFWVWARAFGTGELAMRSLNLLWAGIALTALAHAGRLLTIPWLPLLFAIQPFTWYCMNHARTPLMQMAGGALILAGATGFIYRFRLSPPFQNNLTQNIGKMPMPRGHGILPMDQKRQRGGMTQDVAIFLCSGAVLLCGASMLGLLPLVAVVAGLAVHGVWRRMSLPLAGKILFFFTMGILVVLGIYYGSTLLRGAGGAKIWAVSPANIIFVGYEFLGFQGLGPGRQELRAIMKGLAPASELLPFIPGFLLLASAYLVAFATAYKSWLARDFYDLPSSSRQVGVAAEKDSRPPKIGGSLFSIWLLGIGVFLLSLGMLYILASAVGFPFWGRHLAGAFPFWVLALAITIHWARQGLWRKWGRISSWGILVILLSSSLLIRIAPLHRHDDYRRAAEAALRLSDEGRTVWWVADHSGGVYYGLPISKEITGKPGEIQFAMNRSAIPPTKLPGAIIISRPDNFDVPGAATRLIATWAYRKTQTLQAFEVWVNISEESWN